MRNTKVTILRGLPGTGKDSYLRSLAKADGLKISTASADDYFMRDGEYAFDPAELTAAHDACFRRFVQLCQGVLYPDVDLDVIAVSNTNTCLFEMSPYLMYARYEKLDIEIVEIGYTDEVVHELGKTVPELCASKNVHGVPLEGIQRMYERWESVPPFWPKPIKVQTEIGHFTVIEDTVGRTIPFVR